MRTEPLNEHHWLEKLVGEWNYQIEAACEPGKPPVKSEGTESVRSLGPFWVLCEGRGEMPGGGLATTMMSLGYDPLKQRFVGTWIGSMMCCLWVYDGSLDSAGNILTLDTEGPDFAVEGQLARHRDTIQFANPDQRVLTSHMLGDDGQWHQFMTAHYRRKN